MSYLTLDPSGYEVETLPRPPRQRPILFSGEMVRAILACRKTQTRRLLNPQPEHGVARYTQDGSPGEIDWVLLDADGDPTDSELRCPFGIPGDRLWVRETFAVYNDDYSQRWDGKLPPTQPQHVGLAYRADHIDPRGDGPDYPVRWRSPLFMPCWASRILLEVTIIRVERLQQITEEDARAEGVESRAAFEGLWDRLNAKRAPWDSNPWVWVLGFRRVDA